MRRHRRRPPGRRRRGTAARARSRAGGRGTRTKRAGSPVAVRVGIWNGDRMSGIRSPKRRTSGPMSRRYASRSRPSWCAVSSTSRVTITALPSSSGWANAAGGSTQLRPCRSRSVSAKNGDVRPNGCTALQTSWTNPGSVSSADRAPPPTWSARSSTVTAWPARAIVIAAASPFGPLPMTTASGMDVPALAGAIAVIVGARSAGRSRRSASVPTTRRSRGAPARS